MPREPKLVLQNSHTYLFTYLLSFSANGNNRPQWGLGSVQSRHRSPVDTALSLQQDDPVSYGSCQEADQGGCWGSFHESWSSPGSDECRRVTGWVVTSSLSTLLQCSSDVNASRPRDCASPSETTRQYRWYSLHAINCLERLVSKMTYYALSGTLLTHSLHRLPILQWLSFHARSQDLCVLLAPLSKSVTLKIDSVREKKLSGA